MQFNRYLYTKNAKEFLQKKCKQGPNAVVDNNDLPTNLQHVNGPLQANQNNMLEEIRECPEAESN